LPRLAAVTPVIGSRSSTFEPVITELMRGNGHGLPCVPQTETGARERWAALDASWSGLFEPARR
jgi:hypothetical protein